MYTVQILGNLENLVGSVVPRRRGGYVAAEGTRFIAVDWEKQSITAIAQINRPQDKIRFNDGKVDPAGRFFAGAKSRQCLWVF